jgi:hypothetical protein
MLKVIAAVALVLAFLGPALTASAADNEGNGGDRSTYVADDTMQPEPATPGSVAGTDKPYFGPYNEQRLDNMGP